MPPPTSLRERFARSFEKRIAVFFAFMIFAIGALLMGFLWHQKHAQTLEFLTTEEQRIQSEVEKIRENAERIARSLPSALFTDPHGPYEYVDNFTRELELYGLDVGWIISFKQGAAHPWIDGRRRIVLADISDDVAATVASDLSKRPWPQPSEGSGRSYHFLKNETEPSILFLEAFPIYVGSSRVAFLLVGRIFSRQSSTLESLQHKITAEGATVSNVGISYQGKEIFRMKSQAPDFFDEVVALSGSAAPPETFPMSLHAYTSTIDLWLMFSFFLVICITGITIGIFTIGAWTRRTVKNALQPLQTLVDGTALLATGDFSARVVEPNEEELFALASKFNLLAASLQQTMEKLADAARKEEEARRHAIEAEIIQLRAQLQPHFLFNSLSMVAQTILDNPQHAHEMTLALADLFHAILRTSAKMAHPLEEELSIVGSYLQIQAMRFEHRLTYKIPSLPLDFSMQIPCLALQNLVENALKHGITPVRTGGHIEIRLDVLSNQKRIIIENNGIPIPNNVIEGTGLLNTKRRWKLLHGDNAKLTLEVSNDGKSRSILSVESFEEKIG
jgi:sensor histidine kinase YesM